jgi:hypothetical protein
VDEVSCCATLQLVGEYSVYVNGLMVELALPLGTTLGMRAGIPAASPEVDLEGWQRFHGDAGAVAIRERGGDKLARALRFLRDDPSTAVVGGFALTTRIPLGVGIEDNMLYLVARCLRPDEDVYELASQVCRCEMALRPSSSCIFLMPPFVTEAHGGRWAPLYVVRRETGGFAAPEGPTGNEVCPDRQTVEGWVSGAEALWPHRSCPRTERLHDMMVVARPRVPLTGHASPGVEAAVDRIRDEQGFLLVNLSSVTERVAALLRELSDREGKCALSDTQVVSATWWEVGRLLTCYHYTLHALGCVDTVSAWLVSELLKDQAVLGAKAVGAGPGGAIVILYAFHRDGARADSERRATTRIGAIAERLGYWVVAESVFGEWDRIRRGEG